MRSHESEPGSTASPVKFKDQDYVSLRDACLKTGALFSDPTFAADQSSIGMPADPDPDKAVKWLRPKEISPNAVFVEGTMGTTDICQGQLGNCWLLAALSCLTMHPTLFVKVVPSKQSLTESYVGIFHFKFWQYGEWVEVVVDDRLPVRSGRLLFSYSRTNNEFWSALVEKAYAKLMGSYGSLKGGNISEGMEDFTGGIAFSLPVSSRTPRVLWRALTASLSRDSLLSCFIQAGTWREIGTVTSDGLVKGHAYAITDTDKVKKGSGEVLLLRLRNPWGFVEYCGPWSDKCKDWADIDIAERKRIELTKAEDGEFWISADDFSSLFDTVELCNVNPDSLTLQESEAGNSAWSLTSYAGSWVPMCSAGGSRRYRKSFWKNPQFQLVLSQQDVEEDEDEDEDEDEEDEDEEAAGGEVTAAQRQKEKGKQCTVLVEMLQKDRRRKTRVHFLYIAFHIYRVPPELQDSPGSLDQKFFSSNRPVGRSGKYQPQRGVWRKVHLDPGHYVIIASTYRPNQPCEFFLRIYAKTGNTLGIQDFTCSTDFYIAVMSKPVLPEDHMRVQKWFEQEAGSDNKLNPVEFRKLINSVLEKDYQLPLETCRQLIFGEDSIFFRYDEDSSGTMSPFELSLALQAAGVRCDSAVVQLLWERFGSGESHLPFHGFVCCVARLRVLYALYQSESSPEAKKRGINAWLLRLLAV